MGINRYAKKIDSNQTAIIKALEAAGVLVIVISKPVDLLTYFRGRWLPLEVKSTKPTWAPDKRQERQTEFIAATGCPVVRTAEEALQAVLGYVPEGF
jgi:hypothetical protein